MSGGRFNYIDVSLKNELFTWGDKSTNVFEDREISELVWDVLDLIHDYDYYASADTSEETWLKAKAEFKRKWLKEDNSRAKRIVDDAIAETRQELYKTFGVETDNGKIH